MAKKTDGERMGELLRELGGKKGFGSEAFVDAVKRVDPLCKSGTVRHHWHGTRMPKARALVSYATALGVEPLKLVREFGLQLKLEVEKIVEARDGAAA